MEKHGLDFASIDPEFFSSARIRPSRGNRFKAIGVSGMGAVAVIFAPLGSEGVSVISMRPANVQERIL